MSHRQSPPRRKTRHKATRLHVLHFHCCCCRLRRRRRRWRPFPFFLPNKGQPGRKTRGREREREREQESIILIASSLPAVLSSIPFSLSLSLPPSLPLLPLSLFVMLCSAQFSVVFARLCVRHSEEQRKNGGKTIIAISLISPRSSVDFDPRGADLPCLK